MKPMISDAISAAAIAFGVSAQDICGRSRKAEHARPRLAVYMIARDLLCRSYPQIGRALGRHHTTVMVGCKVAARLIDHDAGFERDFNRAHEWTNSTGQAVPVFRSRRAYSE